MEAINVTNVEHINTVIWAHPKFSFLQFARQFFLAQWIRDNHVEMERCLRTPVEDPLDSGEGLTNDSFIDAQSITKLEDKKAFLLSILDGRNVSTIRYVDLSPSFFLQFICWL